MKRITEKQRPRTYAAHLLYRAYGTLCAKTYFYRINKLLFNLSLRGMGILNYQNARLSGEQVFLQKIVKRFEAPVILDVGANVGMYSNAVKALIPEAVVFAFEPHPETFQRLHRAAAAHGYTALNMACSAVAGTSVLFDYQDAQGSVHASMYQQVLEELHHRPSTGVEIVTETLDAFAATHALDRIHLLKIDAEGHEFSVLQGAQRLLAAQCIDMIHFEFNEMNVFSRTFGQDFAKLLSNYAIYRMLPNGLVPLGPYSPLHYEIFAYQNLVAIRRDLAPTLNLPMA